MNKKDPKRKVINYNSRKDSDDTFHVETHSGRVVARGFQNRAAAQAYIAELMTNYKDRQQ